MASLIYMYLKKLTFILIILFISLYQKAICSDIIDFESIIKINDQGEIVTTEIIKLSIDNKYTKHDIYRELPIIIKNIEKLEIPTNLKIESITQNNKFTPLYTKRVGNNLRIYFSKKNLTIPTGIYVFIIKYKLNNIFSYNEQEALFFWDVTGKNWNMDIKNSSITLILPKNIQDNLKINSNFIYQDFTEDVYGNPVIEITNTILKGENFEIFLTFPKNLIKKPNYFKSKLNLFILNLDNYISIICAILSFLYITYTCFGIRRNSNKIFIKYKTIDFQKFALSSIFSCSIISIISFLLPKHYHSFDIGNGIMIFALIVLNLVSLFDYYKRKLSNEHHYLVIISTLLLNLITLCAIKISPIVICSIALILVFNIFITIVISKKTLASKLQR